MANNLNAIGAANPVTVSVGGTGAASLTDGGVLVGSGTGAVTALAVGATGTLLVGASAADPAFATSANGDFTFTSSTAGATRLLKVDNTSNTANSAAAVQILTGGGTAFDPQLHFTVSGVTDFTAGIDNSDSDKYKISASSTLGTTDTMVITTGGQVTKPLQCAFLSYLGSTVTNATGAGATWTLGTTTALTEVYDVNNNMTTGGTFTAPVTGKYHLSFTCRVNSLTAAMTNGQISIVTTARAYNYVINPGVSRTATNTNTFVLNTLADMTANDTATFTVTISNGAGDTAGVFGQGSPYATFVSGYLVC